MKVSTAKTTGKAYGKQANGSGTHSPTQRGSRVFWALGVIMLALLTAAAAIGVRYAGDLASLRRIAFHRTVSHGGQWIPASRTSPTFIHALIATEDATFYTNWGVSFEGTLRALWVDLRTGQFTQGGSTLTQQLIRDLLLTPRKTLTRKFTGSVLSLYTTALYPKQEILTMFINEVYLGDGAYGIQSAAERYFGLPASRLNLAEGSLLAGLPQAPSAFDPLAHFSLAKARQREVLSRMVATGMISPRQALAAYHAPLPLR